MIPGGRINKEVSVKKIPAAKARIKREKYFSRRFKNSYKVKDVPYDEPSQKAIPTLIEYLGVSPKTTKTKIPTKHLWKGQFRD